MVVMSAFMEWHLGHVVRLIGGRGSGSIPKTMDGNAEVRLSRIAHHIALLDLARSDELCGALWGHLRADTSALAVL